MQHFLKAGFKRYRMTQEQIAGRLGYTQARVSQILSGKIPATKDVELQLLQILTMKIKGGKN